MDFRFFRRRRRRRQGADESETEVIVSRHFLALLLVSILAALAGRDPAAGQVIEKAIRGLVMLMR
jgi:hypothetical protein